VTVLRETRGALTDAALVLADAARLLVRHLPALLTVFLLGLAARNGVLWAAVVLGREHVVLASLLLPLAPLSMVVALVVMLRIAGGSLVTAAGDSSPSRRVAVLTSALVPFLAVYALTGEIKNDRDQFINESYADERLQDNPFVSGDTSARTLADLTSWQTLLILIGGVLVIRLTIDLLDLEERHMAWGIVQVLVEVTWLTFLASLLTSSFGDAREWVGDRVVVAWAEDGWQSVTGRFGPLTEPVRAVGDVLADMLDRLGVLMFIPMAWLAVGAVVIAGGLPASRRARLELPEQATRIHDRLSPGLARWRAPRSRVTAKLIELLGRRFGDLTDGLRIMVHAGVLPVLAFCLVLPLARLAEWGAALVLRNVVGPGDPETMLSFSPYLYIVTRAVYTLVVVVIVVAAVDRLLLRRAASETAPAATSEVTAG
jgi:hypothetical protein